MTLQTASLTVLRRTERALLVRFAGREAWVPASQVRWTESGLWLPTWLAESKGFKAATPDWRTMRRAANVRAAGCADYEPCAAHAWA